MIEENKELWTFEPLSPFGIVVNSAKVSADLEQIPVGLIKELIDKHRVTVFRGFAPLLENAFPQFCEKFGEILEWDFGAVNELSVRDDARNYLYTNREVPFHWDGAFVEKTPHYIVFHCDAAPPKNSGGETLFCDTTLLLKQTPAERQKIWKQIVITYTTEKIVHYGGSFTSPMIVRNRATNEPVLRYAEPVEDLNPVQLEIFGIENGSRAEFLLDLKSRLNHESVCYSHQWQSGDVLFADNQILLHGRRAFKPNVERLIRRVNIL